MRTTRYLPFLRRGFARDGPPLHLTVFVTGRCNLRCRHCFHWKEVAESVAGPSLEELEKLARSAGRMGPLLWVSLGGGEPFMREDLPRIGEAFGREGLAHLAIPTNGLIGSTGDSIAETLERSPELHLHVGISIDGPPAVHDTIRVVEGGHARSLSAFRALRERFAGEQRLGLGLIVTVTRENQDVLTPHVEELVRDLAPDNLTINLARGTAMEEDLLEVDLARYRELVDLKRRLVREGVLPTHTFALARLAGARDDLMYDHVARVAEADGADLGRHHLPCTAGRLSAVVLESGEVHPCEILGQSLGNLCDVDWDLGRLWDSSGAQELREEIDTKRCRCTWECAQADNVLFSKRNWARLALRALR